MVGTSLGHYKILAPLGSGGMGAVYVAEDTRLRRKVALKLVRDPEGADDDEHRRLRQEARMAAELNHPHICTVHEVGEVDGQTFVAMELVEGRSLEELIASGGLPPDSVVDYGMQIAEALVHAHQQGIVHRDLKSGNVMVTADDRVKVLDFGLARHLPGASADDDASTRTVFEPTDAMGGTLPYMAPEILEGMPADERGDIWALGVVLYEAVTGERPFAGPTGFALTTHILRDPVPPLPPEVPAGLATTINKCLIKNPTRRYQSAREVQAALEIATSSRAVPMTPAPRQAEPGAARDGRSSEWPGRLRSGWPGIIALIVVVGLAALAVSSLWPILSSSSSPAAGGGSAAADGPTLAILPLANAGDDPDQAYLGELFAYGLADRVRQSSSASVAPFSTVIGLRGTAEPAGAAEALGVDWVVHGSVNPVGDQLVVSWRLVGIDGGEAEGGEQRARLDQIDEAIASMASEITRLLGLTESPPAGELRRVDPEASQKYLQALDLANGWDVTGNLTEAISLYREAIEIAPGFDAARAGLVMALVERYLVTRDAELWDEARIEAAQLDAAGTTLPEALLAVGTVATVAGESVKAEERLARARELAPGNDAALRSIAEVQARAGRHNEARANFEAAIRLRPNYWGNHYRLGTFLLDYLGEVEEARIHLERATELHPEGGAALVKRGNSHLLRGQLESAKFFYEKALLRGENVNSVDAYSNLGYIHYVQGRYQQALDNWQELLESWPELVGSEGESAPASIHSNVGDALRRLGESERAREHYREALDGFRRMLETEPLDHITRAERTMALASLGQCDLALSDARSTIEQVPDSTLALYYGLQAAARCNRQEIALQWARALIDDRQLLREMWDDPDLEILRESPDVRPRLEAALRAEGLLPVGAG